MWARRIGYLTAVFGCLILYMFYTQWMTWVLLWWLIVLPVLSLLLSLPAMITAKFTVQCPKDVPMDGKASVRLQAQCRFPAPPVTYRQQVRHCITGNIENQIHTNHCGTLEIRMEKLRVYDYLGLFSYRVKDIPSGLITVTPNPVELTRLPGQDPVAGTLIPKRGGGFSEEHELREYLPGDDLRQIHWKLSAKTGKTVVRQPMEQNSGAMVLTLLLRGTPRELDTQLGRLLWLSGALLAQGQKHRVSLLSGRGLEEFTVSDKESLQTMLYAALSAPQASPEAVRAEVEGQPFVIGGQENG